MAKDKLRTIYEDMKEEKPKQLDESLESLYNKREKLIEQLENLDEYIIEKEFNEFISLKEDSSKVATALDFPNSGLNTLLGVLGINTAKDFNHIIDQLDDKLVSIDDSKIKEKYEKYANLLIKLKKLVGDYIEKKHGTGVLAARQALKSRGNDIYDPDFDKIRAKELASK